jgi:glycosyltransferase involved in cell wall biosynthesis
MNKRVTIVIPCLLTGGTEVQTLYLARALKGPCEVSVIVLFEHEPSMVARFEAAGVPVVLLSPSGDRPAGTLGRFAFMFRKLLPAARRERPDIVHTQYMDPGALPIIALRMAGYRNILTTLHVPGHIYRHKQVPVMISRFFTRIFLTVSLASEKSLFGKEGEFFSMDLFKKGRKHFTLHNCVDTGETESLRSASGGKEASAGPRIACISRLSYEKGIDVLIEAMPLVLSKIPGATLTVAGDGSERERLVNQCNELQVTSSVHWAGTVPREEALKMLSGADIAVVPSRFEGFGLTAIEAMALGTPVLASNTDGLAEIIRHGETGWLFTSGDPAALADGVTELWEQPELRKLISGSALETVRDKYSMVKFRQSLLTIYESLFLNT